MVKQIHRKHGLPQVLRLDNVPKFLDEIFIGSAKANGVVIECIQSGNFNVYIERFNRIFG